MSELAWMHLMNKKCSWTAERWHVIQRRPLSRTERNKSHPSSPRHKANKSLGFVLSPTWDDTWDKWPPFDSLFTFPRWSRKKKLIKLSFKQLEQRAHKCLFNQRSTSGSVYREDASCVVSLYMNCFRRYESFIFMWALVLKRTFLVREQKKKTSQEILKASKSREQKRQESESWNSSVVYFYFISDELGLVVNHLESHCRVAMKHLDFMWHISCWSSKSRN